MKQAQQLQVEILRRFMSDSELRALMKKYNASLMYKRTAVVKKEEGDLFMGGFLVGVIVAVIIGMLILFFV